MQTYTKQELIDELIKIKNSDWIKNARPGNAGGIGNTLEDLLGIEENNLPIPNAAEWELKTGRLNTTALTTLFHMEPSPRTLRFVPKIFLLKYGWPHKFAGSRYPENEMSFRQTIHGKGRSDRGFCVEVDQDNEIIKISFDSSKVDEKHSDWLQSVSERVGLSELSPQPYWGYEDLLHKAGTKLLNTFYIQAEVKRVDGEEYYKYTRIQMLQKLNFKKFLDAIINAQILVDFDARTGHNHGTKFRMRQNALPALYKTVTEIG